MLANIAGVLPSTFFQSLPSTPKRAKVEASSESIKSSTLNAAAGFLQYFVIAAAQNTVGSVIDAYATPFGPFNGGSAA